MKGYDSTSAQNRTINNDADIRFDREFLLKSTHLLIAMGIASLYCIGYAIVLFYEFRKMGILQVVGEML